MMVGREFGQQRAMLKYQEAELLEIHRGQGGVEGSDEVLVEPLCLFDLETYSLNGLEFFLG